MAERIPTRDELKGAILWCARMLMAYDGKPYSGPLRASLHKADERESWTVRPMPTLDGMDRPCWFALGEQCETGSPVNASVSEVLRVLLSPDEEKLMIDLVTHQPCTATSVMERCKAVTGKSEFWALWGQFQQRGLVEEGEDKRYVVGPVWLAEWLKGRAGGGKTAA